MSSSIERAIIIISRIITSIQQNCHNTFLIMTFDISSFYDKQTKFLPCFVFANRYNGHHHHGRSVIHLKRFADFHTLIWNRQ